MKRNSILILLLAFLSLSCSKASRLTASEKSSEKVKAEVLLQDSLINYGMQFLNTPYRYGGTTSRGFDCSGFTTHVYKNFGYNLPRSSRDQGSHYPAIKTKDLQRGDLVFFEGRRRNGVVGHVGIVTENLGNGEFKFLHASVNKGVIVSSSKEQYYAPRYLKAGRVITHDEKLTRSGKTGSAGIQADQLFARRDQVVGETRAVVSQASTQYIFEPVYHTVKRGESLSKLSVTYDVPVSTIMSLNDLRNKRLKTGQRLLIKAGVEKPQINFIHPAGDEPESPAITIINGQADTGADQPETVLENQSDGQQYHTVASGETLYLIAKRYHLTVNELKEMNKLQSNVIRVGQKLLVEE